MIKPEKYLLIFVLGLLMSQAKANGPDTLQIAAVKIVKSRTSYFTDDKNIIMLDSLTLAGNFTLDLGELLSFNSSVGIVNYGSTGSVSSVSIRGAGSNHTLVTWNGFPVNSLTTGGADLSLLPVDFADQVSLIHGASASLYGSGTFGGSINLVNKVKWSEQYGMNFSAEAGSFGNQRLGVKINLGNERIQYAINGFFNKARNDFRYTDTEKSGNPSLRLEHNRLLNYGVMQNLSFGFPANNQLDLSVWNQVKEKEIPEIMGSYGRSNQVQEDSTFKSFIRWTKRTARSSLAIRTAYLMDYLKYTDKENATDEYYTIDSRIKSHRILNDVNFRIYVNDIVSFDLGGCYSYLTANTNNYLTDPVEQTGDIFGGVKLNLQRLTSVLTLRTTFTPYKNPGLLYSFGLKYSAGNERLLIRANLSNKFRIPSFNEKYWQPGGDPELLPEKGWGSDIGMVWRILSPVGGSNVASLYAGVYSSVIRNWIQWVPVEGSGIWHPVNYKKVWTRGAELTLKSTLSAGVFDISVDAGYSFILSTNSETNDDTEIIGKQLRYVPVHSANGSIRLQYSRYYLLLYDRFTGKRYTTVNNDPDEQLDRYNIVNVISGMHFGKERNIKLQVRIANLFNSQYQLIRSYPMPGRAYYLSLNAGFGKSRERN
ncbi:MAG: TonB-dependent receptor [Bacteroidales bacterium]|nr:MAG: TonB-dependent receptor [Bacteroidales bacterium]